MKFFRFLESKHLIAPILVIIVSLYLLLAYRNPFKTNNLISNLEPGPDTLYYSVPAWNWVQGRGFKMEALGREIDRNVKPLYGILMIPFFKVFGDFRSYYFLNIILGVISIGLFLKVTDNFYFKSKLKPYILLLVGMFLVTNFYFYNLPSLLMAENIQMVLIPLSVLLIMAELSVANIVFSLVVVGLLWFSKLSNFPVIAVLLFWTLVKIVQTKFWRKLSKRNLFVVGGLLVVVLSILLIKVIIPYLPTLIKGSIWFSFDYCKQFIGYYFSQFLGINGKYLWYNNQQIDKVAAVMSLGGLAIGLIWKKYRRYSLILLSMIVSVVFFHSFMYFPEGRYISIVIPLYMVFSGVLLELAEKFKLGIPVTIIVLLAYFLVRQNINGFYERKATSLKRQILNNRLESNEVPWNYMAIQNYNDYFAEKKDNVYFASLLYEHHFQYFGNGNYNYLPLSQTQEFGNGKSFLKQVYYFEEGTPEFIQKLLDEGNEVYLSNYYLVGCPASYREAYERLEKSFSLSEVRDGCYGLCKIYKVELKK